MLYIANPHHLAMRMTALELAILYITISMLEVSLPVLCNNYVVFKGILAEPCNAAGQALPPHAPPAPDQNPQDPVEVGDNAWHPFESRIEFDFAHYHFVEVQNSAPKISRALDLWAASVLKHGEEIPWKSTDELYATIDSIQHGDAPWRLYKVRYQGARPVGRTPPKWMTEEFELCTRDARVVLHQQLATAEFHDKFDYTPHRKFDKKNSRVWSNLMSGDWAWTQAVWPSLLASYIA